METYLTPFLVSFVSAVALLAVPVLSSKKFILPRREPGRIHKPLSRFGGMTLVLGFLLAVVTNANLEVTPQLLGLLAGSVLVLLVGTWDDLVPLPWGVQLLFQFVLGCVIFLSGMRAWAITNPFGDPIPLHPETALWPSFIVGIIWVTLVMNAINWADGVDGLLGGTSVVAFVTLFLVALRPEVDQPTVAILAVAGVGVSLALLVFNFPPARILAGTAGAYFLGFLITALSLFAGAKIATALLVLAVPVLDALFVTADRIRRGMSPFRGGDARHLHDRLRRIGWSDRAITIAYTSVSAVAAFAALSLDASGKAFFFAVVFACFLLLLPALPKRITKWP